MSALRQNLTTALAWLRPRAQSVAARVASAQVVIRLALLAAAFGIAYRGQLEVEGGLNLSGGLFYFCVAAVLVMVAAFGFSWSTDANEDATSEGSQEGKLAEAVRPLWRRLIPQIGRYWLLFPALALAIAFRVYRLNTFPFGIFFDEAQNGLVAKRILDDSSFRPVFIAGYSQLPALFFYVFALAMRLFGVGIHTLRSVTTVSGLLTIPGMFFLGRELFNRRVGLLATFLLAAMRWHVNFSRIAFHGIFAPMLMVWAFYFLIRGLRGRSRWNFVVAGVLVGVGMQSYYAFMVVPIVLLLYVGHHVLFEARHRPAVAIMGTFAVGVVALAVYAPVLNYAIHNGEEFNRRIDTVSITKGKSPSQARELVLANSKTYALMFNAVGDTNPRHNLYREPMVDRFTGILLVLGVALSLSKLHRSSYFLMIVWMVALLQPGIWSIDPAQGYRTLMVTPAVALLAALPLALAWELAVRFRGGPHSDGPPSDDGGRGSGSPVLSRLLAFGRSLWPSTALRAITFLGIGLVLGVIGWKNYDIYFNKQAHDGLVWIHFSAGPTVVGNEIKRLRPENYQFFVSTTFVNEPTRIFLDGPDTTDIASFDVARQIPVHGTRPTDVFLDTLERQHFLRLKTLYPNGDFTEHRPPGSADPAAGDVVTYEAILDTDDVRSLMGINAVYTGADGQRLESQEGQIDADWTAGTPLALPFNATWSGFITMRDYGEYLLGLRIPGHARILLDGELFAEGDGIVESRAVLFQGPHQIDIEADVGEEGRVQLYWQRPAMASPEPVSGDDLFSSPLVYSGLRASYYNGTSFLGSPVLERLDPFIAFRYGGDLPVSGPFGVSWKGKLLAPTSGSYGIRLSTIGDGRLMIDGQQILTSAQQVTGTGKVSLEAGPHDIQVIFTNSIGSAQIFLSWQPPDGDWVDIPTQYFSLR